MEKTNPVKTFVCFKSHLTYERDRDHEKTACANSHIVMVDAAIFHAVVDAVCYSVKKIESWGKRSYREHGAK
jgi:hypothetical protein